MRVQKQWFWLVVTCSAMVLFVACGASSANRAPVSSEVDSKHVARPYEDFNAPADNSDCQWLSKTWSLRALECVFEQHKTETDACYDKGKALQPDGRGHVDLRIVVFASGAVDDVAVEASSLKSPATQQCLIDTIKHFYFPPPPHHNAMFRHTLVFGQPKERRCTGTWCG